MKDSKSPQSSKLMLMWQWRTILEELQQIALHASDPQCPCVLSDQNPPELCLPKHCLNVRSLCAETAPMDKENKELFETIADEALTLHNALKDRIVCGKQHKDEDDAVEWSRKWRKKIEAFYYYQCKAHKLSDPGMERVVATFIGVDGAIKHTAIVSDGGKHSAPLPVDRILAEAHKHHATGLILAHNHPSGSLNLSDDDVRSTKILCQRAAEAGVKCLDHLVLGNGVSSFSQKHIKLADITYPENIPPVNILREKLVSPELVNMIPPEYRHLTTTSKLLRVEPYDPAKSPQITRPGEATPFFRLMRDAPQEYLMVVLLNTRNHVVGLNVMAIGTRDAALVPKDEIFKLALLANASNILLAHNHPSGDSSPSSDDRRIFKELEAGCTRSDIKVLDMIVIGKTKGYSIKGDDYIEYSAFSDPILSAPKIVHTPDVRVTGCRSKKTCTMNHYARDAFRESVVSPKERPATIAAIEKELKRGRKAGTPETFALGAKSLSRYELRYRIVGAHDLQVSHDPMTFVPNPNYPQELQPRDRSRAADQAQVITMAAKLDPEALLTEFHSIDRGSPIIGSDFIVESGNGRIMALARGITENPDQYQKYLDALHVAAPEYGIPASELAKFEHPVLVRERLTVVDRATFGKEANLSTSLGSSPIETARADASLLRVQDIFNLEVGENQGIDDALRASVNAGFVKAFLGQLELNQRANVVDAEGKLNQEGIRRLTMAMFVRAFPGDTGLRLAEKFFESTGEVLKNVMNGILKALGKLAQAEALVASGQRSKDLSIADDLTKAVNILARIKATQDYTVTKYLAQMQLQTRELTPFQEKLLTELDKRSRSGKAIGEMLNAYAQAMLDSSPPSQGGLLDLPPLTKEDLWNTASKRSEVMVSDAERGVQLLDPLGAYVDLCNLSLQDQGGIWNYRPLREFVMWASGLGEVQLCNVGFVPGSLQITVKGIEKDKREAVSQRASKVPNLKEIVQFGDTPDKIFTILIPRTEATASELLGGQQFVEARVIHSEKGQQFALFDAHQADIDDSELYQSAEQAV